VRLFSVAILTLVVSCWAFGQTYTISTVAGGGSSFGDNGQATSAQLNDPWRIAVDALGNLYIADTGNYRVRKVANGVITTVAGNGTQGFSGDGGPATSAQLGSPFGVAVDSAGNLYIADEGKNRVRKVSNGVITTVAGNGVGGFGGDGGPATSAQLLFPFGVAVDSAGNLYIADTGNNRVRKVSNGVISTVAGNGTAGFGGDNGPAISAQLQGPGGVAADSAGNVYVADSNNSRIRKVSNGVITTVAGGGRGDNSPATSAGLGAIDVAVDSGGNLYIADGYNSIRKVSNGVITTVAGNGTFGIGFSGDSGPATSAGLYYPQGVAVDVAGKVYIADEFHSRIRVLTPSGPSCTASVAPLALSPAASGGNLTLTIQTSTSSCAWAIQSLPDWITFSGNVVGTGSGSIALIVAADTGASRAATVSVAGLPVQVNQQGGYVPCSYALSPGDQAFPAAGGPGSVAVTATSGATSGCSWTATSNVTWITFSGGASGMGNGTVTYQVAANTGGARSGNLTIAGLPFVVEQSGAVIGSGNMAGNWQFSARSNMFGLAFSVTGQIAQTGNSVSGQLSITGTPCATTATFTGTLSSTGVLTMNLNENGQVVVFSGTLASDGNSASGTYSAPSGGCTNGDKGTWSGQRVSTSSGIVGGVISTVAGNGSAGFTGDGGPATSAKLSDPSGVAIDGAGNIYIADDSNNRIRKVSPNGTITTVAGTGIAGYSGDGGPATDAQLNIGSFGTPSSIGVDSAGNLYIADSSNQRIRKVSTNGTITTVAGNGTRGFSGDGGPATSAELQFPWQVAVDSLGSFYISDYGNQRIRKVSTSGIITTVAGNGTAGFSWSDDAGVPATSAQLHWPEGIALDSAGNLYIADYENNRIRKVSGGAITTVAGDGSPDLGWFSGDGGPATSATLSNPTGVAVDGTGTLYIAEAGSERVRQVSASGIITTAAGNGSGGFSGDGGPAVAADLTPDGIGVDMKGNLYIAGVERVRMVQIPSTNVPGISGIENGASNSSGPIVPGEIVVLYGSGIGPAQLVKAAPDSGGSYGTQLANASVSFNGIAAPMIHAWATQTAAIVPYGITGASAQVTVTYQGQTSAAFSTSIASSAPGIFTYDSSGQGPAAAINQDGITVNTAATPTKIGDIISLYATGEGQTTPAGVDGKPASVPYPYPNLPVTVTVGGQNAPVKYAGGAPGMVAGLMQVNVQIPTGIPTGNGVPVVLRVGSVFSQGGVTISVR